MPIQDVLDQLRGDADFMANVAAWERIPPRAAREADFPASLDASLVRMLQSTGINSLYTHQAQMIRKQSGIMISNPDMLHRGILPNHTRWAQFFENLHYVVLDELHSYRGIFGSHMANVMRRLRRICRFYGAEPIFLCASATI